jgi:hypothetical protein
LANTGEDSTGDINLLSVFQGMSEIGGWMAMGRGQRRATEMRKRPVCPSCLKEILKKLQETKDFSPEELQKLQHLKLKIEFVGEAADLKKIGDLLKQLAPTQ